MKTFRNEPLTDFKNEKNRQKMADTLAKVKKELGRQYPLIINGKAVKATRTFQSLNPSNTQKIIGTFQEADEDLSEQAIRAALDAFKKWQWVPPKKRARYLFEMAKIMRKKKFELAAWMIYEVGKNWKEADGDVAEAIDFLEYYGREMIRLSASPKLVPLPGEKNRLSYLPLGIGAIITPWNFPLAILTGMTLSATVTGNTTVVKPSEFSSAIALQFMKVVSEAGLPGGVINLLTGQGATVGKYLVRHPKIRFISFTGSKKVGLEISEAAAKTMPGQKWIKRVVVEMGGKDAIIVDRESNIDEAADGVVRSAFGFQGQKCSACSRAIVDEKIYEAFVEKLLQKTRALSQGDPQVQPFVLGPLVSKTALDKAKKYIEIGKGEGKLLLGGDEDTSSGYFIQPTIFGEVPPGARIAQEEIFAPVLALVKAKNFDHALEIANSTEYGLTGAFYTNNPAKIKKGIREFYAGNLYVNRGCTGALVGAHPFGGFNMSGTDSKAGGPDYLLLFMQAKSISQKLDSKRRKRRR